MPSAPARACKVYGCANHEPCPEHGRKAKQRQQDERRGSRQQRGYTRVWEHSSQQFLAEFPLCGMRPNGQMPVMSECHDKGLVTVAYQTDHVVPHKGNQQLFWDREGNWQALCRSCGARKSAAGL